MTRMTKQEMFDRVWDHFVVQENGPSHQSGRCRYRGPNGSRCAVGVLIPDEMYHVAMEGRVVGGLHSFQGIFDVLNVEENEDFLVQLQRAHDRAATLAAVDDGVQSFHEKVEFNLRDVAKRWNLTVPTTENKENE